MARLIPLLCAVINLSRPWTKKVFLVYQIIYDVALIVITNNNPCRQVIPLKYYLQRYIPDTVLAEFAASATRIRGMMYLLIYNYIKPYTYKGRILPYRARLI